MRRDPPSLRVLVGTQFCMFLAKNGLPLVGTWVLRIACSWLIWDWTHSAFWLGIRSGKQFHLQFGGKLSATLSWAKFSEKSQKNQ